MARGCHGEFMGKYSVQLLAGPYFLLKALTTMKKNKETPRYAGKTAKGSMRYAHRSSGTGSIIKKNNMKPQ